MTESTETTSVGTQESPVIIEVESCKKEICPICSEKKEKSLHEQIIDDRINIISKTKALLLKIADRAQEDIDNLIKMRAEIQAGLVPEATLFVLKEMMTNQK